MRVLLVEDNLDFQRSLKEMLVKAGFTVHAVSDGVSALRRLKGADVLITDIGIPCMDGLNLCTEARLRRPGLAVIVMTGCDSGSSRQEARRRGAAFFLSKPFDREVLLACLRSLEPPVENQGAPVLRRSVGRALR
jgi:two-component system, NtrC family, response regulator AtoC